MQPINFLVLNNNTKGILFATLTAVLWGFLAIALKVAVSKIDPFTIVWFRFTLAFTTLFFIFFYKNQQKLSILYKPPLLLIVAALFLGLNYLGFLTGIQKTSPNSAQVVMQIGPVILALIGVLVFKERIVKRQAFGFVLAFVGLFLFYRQQITAMTSKDLFNEGMMWIFIGAFSWVIFAVLQKRLVARYQPQQLNLMLYGLPAFVYVFLAEPASLSSISWPYWLLLVFLGLNTLLAYGALAEALKFTDANTVSVILICNPIITIVAMWILGNYDIPWLEKDVISPESLLFAALVLGGAVMAVVKGRTK